MTKKYTNAFSAIHWIHAAILIFILIGALLNLPELPDKGGDLSPFKGHMILGFLATLIVIVRLIMLKKQPELEPLKMDTFRENIVRWNHRLIYLFILLTGISGMVTAKSANLGQVLIFGENPSVYTGPDGITALFSTIHTISAYTLGILIVMHIIGTVLYIMKTKENILKRVGFGK